MSSPKRRGSPARSAFDSSVSVTYRMPEYNALADPACDSYFSRADVLRTCQRTGVFDEAVDTLPRSHLSDTVNRDLERIRARADLSRAVQDGDTSRLAGAYQRSLVQPPGRTGRSPSPGRGRARSPARARRTQGEGAEGPEEGGGSQPAVAAGSRPAARSPLRGKARSPRRGARAAGTGAGTGTWAGEAGRDEGTGRAARGGAGGVRIPTRPPQRLGALRPAEEPRDEEDGGVGKAQGEAGEAGTGKRAGRPGGSRLANSGAGASKGASAAASKASPGTAARGSPQTASQTAAAPASAGPGRPAGLYLSANDGLRIVFEPALCSGCGACVEACDAVLDGSVFRGGQGAPPEALDASGAALRPVPASADPDAPRLVYLDSTPCVACGACLRGCAPGALRAEGGRDTLRRLVGGRLRVPLRLARKLSTTVLAAVVARDVASDPAAEAAALRALRDLRFDAVLPETLGVSLLAGEYAGLLGFGAGEGAGDAPVPLLSAHSAAWRGLVSARGPELVPRLSPVRTLPEVMAGLIRREQEALRRLAAEEEGESFGDRDGGLKGEVSVVLVTRSPDGGRIVGSGGQGSAGAGAGESISCAVTPEDLEALAGELVKGREGQTGGGSGDSAGEPGAYFPGSAAAKAISGLSGLWGMADAMALEAARLAGADPAPAEASDALWESPDGKERIVLRTYGVGQRPLRVAVASGPAAMAQAVGLLSEGALSADFVDATPDLLPEGAEGAEAENYRENEDYSHLREALDAGGDLGGLVRSADSGAREGGGRGPADRAGGEAGGEADQEPSQEYRAVVRFSTQCIRFDSAACTGCGAGGAGEGATGSEVCQRCVLACRESGVKCLVPVDGAIPPLQARPLSGRSAGLTAIKLVDAGCTGCGACVQACPAGAFAPAFDAAAVLREIRAPGRAAVAILDPSTPIEGGAAATLCSLGFAAVYDVRCGAQLVVQAVAERLRSGKLNVSPVVSSDCPGFVALLREKHPDLVPRLAAVRTPAEILGAAIKRNWGKVSAEGRLDVPDAPPFVAFIGNCVAQKALAGAVGAAGTGKVPDTAGYSSGPGSADALDAVLTARDLAALRNLAGSSGSAGAESDAESGATSDSGAPGLTPPFAAPAAACAAYGLPGALSDTVLDYLRTSESVYADFNEDGAAEGGELGAATEVKETQLWQSKDGSQKIFMRKVSIGEHKFRFLVAEGGRACEKAAGMVAAEKISCDLLDARVCPGGCPAGPGRGGGDQPGGAAPPGEEGLSTEAACARVKELLSGPELVAAMARAYH